MKQRKPFQVTISRADKAAMRVLADSRGKPSVAVRSSGKRRFWPATKKTAYRVWLGQVNATYIDVNATSLVEAEDKALREWRREYGPQVLDSRRMDGLILGK